MFPAPAAGMLDDLRQAFRSLARVPAFSAVAVVTFALGVGATTAIYSVVSRVLLRPLPLAAPDRLVTIWTRMPDAKIDQLAVAHAEYLDYRAETALLEEVGAYTVLPATLTGVGQPARLSAGLTTASLWSVVRIAPALGRTLGQGDDVAGAEPVAVLSHALWRSRFGADPAAVGRTIELDGKARRIVGVMPAGFDFTQSAPDIWIPYVLDPTRRDNHHLLVLGRMKASTSFAMLQGEMDAIVGRWAKLYAHHHPMFALPLRETIAGGVRAPLAVLFGAAVLVLLVSASNVAGLLLARGESRQRELAIRAALGAGHTSLLRRVLAESILLAVAGGALGLVVAKAGLAAILSLDRGGLPRVGGIGLDLPVLAFAFALSVLAGVLAGLVPAWRISRPDLAGILKGSGERTAAASGRQRLRSALVVAETATAMVLVAGAALLVRGLWTLTRVDPGVDPDHVLAAQVILPAATYPKAPDVVAFYDRLRERLGALPGVRSAALVNALPMRDGGRLILVGGPWQPPNAEPLGAEVLMVSPGYFATLGTRILRGRPFAASDGAGAARVAALNPAAARALFGSDDPLGKPLSILQAQPREPAFEIVAVVSDVRTGGLGSEPGPQVYLPLAQAVTDIRGVTRAVSVALKTDVDPASLGGAVRRAIWALDPKLAVANLETMDTVVAASLGPQRLQASLLGAFAGLALVLAAIGLYGLLAHLVGLRRRELGIRLALGARPGQLLGLVLRQGLALTALGVAAGAVVAAAAGRVLAGLVHGVGSWDPTCLAATAVTLLLTAAAAGYVPARRAARLDPAVTIREE
jgi:putative ABC transport system permease protein